MKKVDEFIKNPKKSLFRLALPIVIATFVQTLYNVVDTAYVGRLGSAALAAISFSFPLYFLLIAILSGINAGMQSRISRYLGEKKQKAAENSAMHGILISIVMGIILFIVGPPSLDWLFSIFGATAEVSSLAKSYMSVIFYGSVFMFLSYIYNGIFSAQGNTKTPMKIMISSTVTNLILDPFFIFSKFNFLGINFRGFGLGIQGAGIATVIAFFVGFCLFLVAVRKVSYLHIHIKNFHFSTGIIKDIFKVGMPSSIMMFLMSFYTIFLNRVFAYFGVDHVATFGMVVRLESVAIMPVVGFSIGLLTLVGMFYGARRYDLLKSISFYAMKVGVVLTLATGLIFFVFPNILLRIFTNEQVLIFLGTPLVRIDVFTFPLMAITMMISRVMQGMGKGLPGLILNLIRIFIVAIPLAYIFVFWIGLGYLSVAYAMIVGGLASSLTGVFWLRARLGKLNSKSHK